MSVVSDIREIASFRELIVALGMREVRVRYKHTLLGIGWAVALPLSLMLVFTFVFSKVARVETHGVPYPVFAYLGLLPWQLHANIINQGARSLVDNRALVTKVYFAREVLPLSAVLSALVDFCVASVVLAGLMLYYGMAPGIGLLLVPVVVLVQLAFGVGCALALSAANLLYRDVQYILQVGVLLWMFASSVVYPIPRTGDFLWLVYCNPMTPILDAYRGLIVGGKVAFAPEFGVAALVSVLVLVVAWRWFRRVERVFGELA
ncbi:MAG: ABC transporter permease [Planctomycetes bacterium]|nr:ABC transporter permease [Planctomycetota bacterium]